MPEIFTDSFYNFILHLADNSLVMGHRLSEWTGHGPMLEQDIAVTNIALDEIGAARNFYQYAAVIKNEENKNATAITEDDLAYLRDSRDYKNFLITELPNGDWGKTILKIFFFSAWQSVAYEKLMQGSDEQIAAIAAKSLKEVAYHIKWSGEWVVRLGDGTAESNTRMAKAIESLWPYTGEMFQSATWENSELKNRVGLDVSKLKKEWLSIIDPVLAEADLSYAPNTFMHSGGKEGMHTEQLGYLLAEMQYLQRAYPGCEW